MTDFIIAAPPFSARSGGIVVLHELCSALNALGHRAGMALITEGSQERQGFKFAFTSDKRFFEPKAQFYDYFSGKTAAEISGFIQGAIIIYPDIITGNPLGGRTFVSYVLGVPRIEVNAPFILGFSTLYTKLADAFLFKPFLSPYITDSGSHHWTVRSLSLTYIGKGAEYLNCERIPGTILVERDWPRDKEQLGILLRNCKYFLTWDCVSATNFDAVMCGAVPVLLHDLQIPRSELNKGELGPFPFVDNIPAIFRDIRYTPENVSEIDRALQNGRDKALKFQEAWLANVQEVVEKVLLKSGDLRAPSKANRVK